VPLNCPEAQSLVKAVGAAAEIVQSRLQTSSITGLAALLGILQLALTGSKKD
jgi:hypothetical protein